MMEVTLRPLNSANDMDDWRRMRFALWPHYSEPEMEAEMQALLADIAQQPVFVAVAPDGQLCGLMEATIHAAAPGCTSARIGYLEAWWVDMAWRRHGIGRRLVEAAETWAREQGCVEMASDTNAGYPLSPQAHGQIGYEIVSRDGDDIFFRKAL